MRCRPASPVSEVSMAKPSISSRVCNDSRISASSSMMRMAPARPGAPFNSVCGITAVSDIFGLGNSLPAQGEIQGEGGAFPRMAFYTNLASVFLDDAVGHGKTEAGAAGLAFAGRSLSSKERIVNALNVLGRDRK